MPTIISGTSGVSQAQIKTINGNTLLGEGNVVIDKVSIGLSNVDNTSDANKPVSTAQSAQFTAQNNQISAIQTTVSGVQTDIATINSDISAVESSVSLLNSDISAVEVDVLSAQTDISNIGTQIGIIVNDIANLDEDDIAETATNKKFTADLKTQLEAFLQALAIGIPIVDGILVYPSTGYIPVSSVSSPSANEGSPLIYNIILSSPTIDTTNYGFSLSGTAISGTNYSLPPTFSNGVTSLGGTLTIPSGVTSFTLTISTIDDGIDTANRTLILSVGGVVGTGTIVDTDTPVDETVIGNGESLIVTNGESLNTAYPIRFDGDGYISFGTDASISDITLETLISNDESLVLAADQALSTPYPIRFDGNGYISFAPNSYITQLN